MTGYHLRFRDPGEWPTWRVWVFVGVSLLIGGLAAWGAIVLILHLARWLIELNPLIG